MESRDASGVIDLPWRPLVSVIIPTYNDVEHLLDAIESVRQQTVQYFEIIVADDCSTDGTREAVDRAYGHDPRVRYLGLSVNTGGAGAPRNRALEIAAGEYVMYLDSDDLLDRHACRNLVTAARGAGADIASGLTVRRAVDTGRTEQWYGHLYAERRAVSGIDEFPELTHDTLITNKAFRTAFLRDHGLGFPEHMHYEDVVFAAQVYAAARGIVVIPERVYQWNVYPAEVRQSITNQRSFRKNLDDRLQAIELVREAFAAHDDRVHDELDQKVLTHHLRLYLNDLQLMEPEDARGTLVALREAAQRVRPSSFAEIRLVLRLLYAAAFAQDLDAVLVALRGVQRGAFPGVVVRDTAGGARWTPAGVGSELQLAPEWEWLVDVTDESILRVPHSQFEYLHRLLSIEGDGGDEYVLTGEFSDPLGKVDPQSAGVELVHCAASGAELWSAPLALDAHGSVYRWNARVPGPRRRGWSDRDGRTFMVRVRLENGAVSVRPLFGDLSEPFAGFRDGSVIGRALRDRWEFTSGINDRVELQIRSGSRLAKALRSSHGLVEGPKRVIAAVPRRILRAVGPQSALGRTVVYPLMRTMPLDRSLILFESNLGLAANDSPFAIYRAASSMRERYRFVWSLAPGAHRGDVDARDAVVRRHSYAYFWALARAAYIVDNQSMPDGFVKRAGQRYLQTWHGIPLKKMGMDEPRFANAGARKRLQAVSGAWDLLTIPSPYFESTFVPAYAYTGECIRYGTPRNDELVRPIRSVDEIRGGLDIPSDVRVMLYAPTFRESRRNRASAARMHVDLEAWVDRFGDEYVLLVRAHYLNRFAVPERLRGAVIDVSGHANVAELYQIADLLITDYSSVMFDYAHLRRPIVLFAPDYDEYVSRSRGVYFDLSEHAPGEFVRDAADLNGAIDRSLAAGIAPRHERFLDEFCGREDGHSAQRSLAALLEGADSA